MHTCTIYDTSDCREHWAGVRFLRTHMRAFVAPMTNIDLMRSRYCLLVFFFISNTFGCYKFRHYFQSIDRQQRQQTLKWTNTPQTQWERWKQCDRCRVFVFAKNIPNFPLLFCKWVARGAMITDKNRQRRQGMLCWNWRRHEYAARVLAYAEEQCSSNGKTILFRFHFRFFAHFIRFVFFIVRHLFLLHDGRASTNTRSKHPND